VTVSKINGFRAPYRSQTLQNQAREIVGLNGVMRMDGEVSQDGSTITIPPFVVNQNGLIITEDQARSIAAPLNLDAPYTLIVSAQTSAQVDDLLFQFVKDPNDIGPEEVPLASYDGVEWRNLPLATIYGVYQELFGQNVDFGLVGVYSGLETIVNGPNYENLPGVLVDKIGLKRRIDEIAVFPIIDPDPVADWLRVDRVVFRRPTDAMWRVGVRKLLVGSSFIDPQALGPDSYSFIFAPSGSLPGVALRINTSTSGSDENFDIVVDDGDKEPFLSEIQDFMSRRGGFLEIVDKSGVKWRLTAQESLTITTQNLTAEAFQIRLIVRESSEDVVEVLKNGVKSTVSIFSAEFSSYSDAEQTNFDTNNPSGILQGDLSFGVAKINENVILPDSSPTQKVVSLFTSDNRVIYLTAKGYGDTFRLTFSMWNEARDTALVPDNEITTIPTCYYSAIIDENDLIHILYSSGDELRWISVNLSGLIVSGPAVIAGQSKPIQLSRSVYSQEMGKILIVYNQLESINNNQLYFTSITTSGSAVTAPKRLTNDLANYVDLDVSLSQDNLLYIVYEEILTTSIAYMIVDDIGEEKVSPLVVSGDTDYKGVPLTNQAKQPKIWISDTQSLAITFLQLKPSGDYGVATVVDGDALMVDLINEAENFTAFDTSIDSIFGDLHMVATQASRVDYIKFKPVHIPQIALPIDTTDGASSVVIEQDKKGSWVTAWSKSLKTTFSSFSNSVGIAHIGSATVNGGLNTIEPDSSQCLAIAGDFSRAPINGDKVTITGSSQGNNGDYLVESATLVSLNSANDHYLITMQSVFNSPESPASGVDGDFQEPDGNEVKAVKHTGDLYDDAHTLAEHPADILLSRIAIPGPDVLNVAPTSSDLDNDRVFALSGNSVVLDWGDTVADSLTIAGQLSVTDLVNTTTWDVTPGSYEINESEAIYIELDPEALTVIPKVTNEQYLPFGERIFVLGVVKDGRLQPAGLVLGAFTQFEQGEIQRLGQNLSATTRSKLGIVNDTTMESLSSTIGSSGSDTYPTTLSQTNIMAGQNRHIKLVGGTFDWQNQTTDELTLVTDVAVQVPGVPEDQNNIQAASFSITEDQVLWVNVNRVDNGGTPANIAPQVSNVSTLALTRDTYIIARRVGENLYIDPWNTMVTPGNRVVYGSSLAQDELTERRVKVINLEATTLPAGASIIEDGISLVDGDKVLYANSALNGIFQVSGIGSSAVWIRLDDFQGKDLPGDGQIVHVSQGTSYFRSLWQYKRGAWWPVETQDFTGDPTGFPNLTQSVITFNDATRDFEIAPSVDVFDYFIKGRAYRKASAQQIQIPDVSGQHWIYFDGENLLSTQTLSKSLFTDYALVASIYWNSANSETVLAGELRHGLNMDGVTTYYLHETSGAVVTGLNSGNLTTVGDGSSDAHAQLSIGDGQLINEDLFNEIFNGVGSNFWEQQLDPILYAPVLYRDGSPGTWRRAAAVAAPVGTGASRVYYNQDTGGGTWQRTEASADGKFIAYFIVATNDVRDPIVSIMGQGEYDTLEEAQEAEGVGSISRGDLPGNDSRLAYRLIFETSSAYGNTFKAALRDIADYRGTVELGNPTTPTDHGSLSGLNQQDHPASAIYTSTINFEGVFDASDDDVQKALEAINKFLKALQLKEHPVNKKRVILTSADSEKSDGTHLSQQFNSFLMAFDGAEVDFSTGEVFESDGTTPLGIDFTPADIAPNQYRWYSISLTPLEPTTDNRLRAGLVIGTATSDGANAADASKAIFIGDFPVGQVVVQRNAGDTDIEDILQTDIVQLGVGSGSGSGGGSGGSGGGGAAINPTEGFQLAVVDEFDVDSIDLSSFVDPNRTNASWTLTTELWTASCDKGVEATTVDKAFSFAAFPGFTFQPGDIIYSTAQGLWRTIATVTDQQNGTLDASFPVDLSSEIVMVSQAIWTKDLVNKPGSALQSTRPRDVFPDTTINVIAVDYQDSLIPGDTVADVVDDARMAVSATAYGDVDSTVYPISDKWTPIQERVPAPDILLNYPLNPVLGLDPQDTYDGTAGVISNLDYTDDQTIYGYDLTTGLGVALNGIRCAFTLTQDTPDLFASTTVKAQIWSDNASLPDTMLAESLPASLAPFLDLGNGTHIVEMEFAETFVTPTANIYVVFIMTGLPTTNVWQAALANQTTTEFAEVPAYFDSADGGSSWNRTAFPLNNGPYFLETLATGGTSVSQRLFLVFFPNPNNNDVTNTANLIKHRTSFYYNPSASNGGTLDSAYCMSDGSGIPVNCTNPVLEGGVTRVNLDFNYVPGINPGTPAGDLEVMVDGKFLPRYMAGVTTDGYYKEVLGDNTAIDFWVDLSPLPLSIDIRRRQGTLDTSDQNKIIIEQLTSILEADSASQTVWVLLRKEFTRIQVNSQTDPMTLVLPANPEIGDVVDVVDVGGNAGTNNISVSFNGENFFGQPDTDNIDINYTTVRYEYAGSSTGWIARM
jgi:hypothetical protein